MPSGKMKAPKSTAAGRFGRFSRTPASARSISSIAFSHPHFKNGRSASGFPSSQNFFTVAEPR